MNVSFNVYVITSVLMLPVQLVLSQNSHSDNEIPDFFPSNRDRVCTGYRSGNGMSLSGSFRNWYEGMRRHYNGCTYVNDNLILTWFMDSNITYDFSFLRNIRYVRGYVLIAVSAPWMELPLDNLEIIRANKTFLHQPTGSQAGLAILLTNFTTIRLPKLIEISNGDVITKANAESQRIETSRSWDDIMRGRATSVPGSLQLQHGNEPALWMEDSLDVCPESCPHRCFRFRRRRYLCCNSQCAGGCNGPRSYQCEKCLDFNQYGECVSHCADPFFRRGGRCVFNPRYNGGLKRNIQP